MLVAVLLIMVGCLVGAADVALAQGSIFQGLDRFKKLKLRAHPLAAQRMIWSALDGRFVTEAAFLSELRKAPIVLLGEVHDNPMHHALRGSAIGKLVRSGPRRAPAVVFEQIRLDQQPVLEQFKEIDAKAGRLATTGDLFRLLEWAKGGWPVARIYQPLFTSVVQQRLPIIAGDPPRETIRAVAMEGEGPVAGADRERMKLSVAWDVKLQDSLLKELEGSHCGLLPRSAFTNMAVAQRYRDAHLADAVLQATATHGAAVLIAGNGHVRSDRGVPWYLRERVARSKVVAVMLIEVEEGKTEPASYVERGPDGGAVADYIVFTPRAERTDPCIEMKKRFQGK